MEPLVIVFIAVLVQDLPSLLEVAGLAWTKRFLLHRSIHPLYLTIGLRVVPARKNLLDFELLQKPLKIVADELGTVIIDQPWPCVRILFFHPLNERIGTSKAELFSPSI